MVLIQEKSREYVFLETRERKVCWDWDLLFYKQFASRAQFGSEESVQGAEAKWL